MKVTVSKYLNVRVGAPRLDAPNYQYLAPGSILEVDGKLYEGQNYDGNTLWYKDLTGNYYWSGGIVDQESDLEQDILLDGLVDFRKIIKLKNWSFRQLDPLNPSEVKIAILDSGIYAGHPDFFDTSSFLPNSNKDPIMDNENYIDEFGHGTLVAGIIGGRNNDTIGITGICPDSHILSIKTLNKEGSAYANAVKNGLIELKKYTQIKIVNLSFALAPNSYQKISHLFDELAMSKILIAAAGNEEILGNEPKYPARNANVISVASFPMKALLNPLLKLPKGLDYIMPKLEVISTSNNPEKLYEAGIGSSFAVPIVASLIAELSTVNSNITNKKTAIKALNRHCYSLQEFRNQFKNLIKFQHGLPVIKTH